MRALVVDDNASGRLTLGEVPDPAPAADQVLVRVQATSLNFGELPLNTRAPAGTVPGWDAAGIVVQAAAGGGGPAVGTPVVTQGANGAWAELRAVHLNSLAVLPDNVDVGAAATLPIAGVSALRALRASGPLLGKRVLITGASGGVGRYAVQLAHRAGANVIAVVGSEARGRGLAALGADEIVVGLDRVQSPVHAVLDNVGGPQLVRAFQLLAPGGLVQAIGAASREPSTFPPGAFVGPDRGIVGFIMLQHGPVADDLQYLVGLLAAGELDPQIDWRGSWDRASEAEQLLLARKIAGKAVLDIPA
jgi:NADPH:quinone reductase-like Zn-dependent oxidoreductase